MVHVPKGRAPGERLHRRAFGGRDGGGDRPQPALPSGPSLTLRPRDLIIAYTDGMVDTTNFSGERFGKKRLRGAVLAAITEAPDATAAQVVDRIMWEVRRFAGLSPRPDDQTLIAVRVH